MARNTVPSISTKCAGGLPNDGSTTKLARKGQAASNGGRRRNFPNWSGLGRSAGSVYIESAAILHQPAARGTRERSGDCEPGLGLLSLACLGPVFGIPAVICGHIARGKARRQSAQHGGAGFKHPALDFVSLQPANLSSQMRSGAELADTNVSEALVMCPIHHTVLHCDGSVERPQRKTRRLGE